MPHPVGNAAKYIIGSIGSGLLATIVLKRQITPHFGKAFPQSELMYYQLTSDQQVQMSTPPPEPRVPNVLLYADDDTAQLTLKRALFELWGYDVLTAVSGEQACEAFGRSTIDIAVLDYNMSPMDGGEAACAIRQGYPTLPIILYTAELDLPRHALNCVSKLVRKAESIEVLRAALNEFSPRTNKTS